MSIASEPIALLLLLLFARYKESRATNKTAEL
jgi:hypothetical protein